MSKKPIIPPDSWNPRRLPATKLPQPFPLRLQSVDPAPGAAIVIRKSEFEPNVRMYMTVEETFAEVATAAFARRRRR